MDSDNAKFLSNFPWSNFQTLADEHIRIKPGQETWDIRFLRLAREVSFWSKDPSTKCGAIIVDQHNNIVATGINGFPKNVSDDPKLYENRDIKYRRIIHCEMNALLRAKRDLCGHTLYTWPLMSCDRCCPHIIQSGITRCVAPEPTPYILERWKESMEFSTNLFAEAGVEVVIYPTHKI